MSESARVLQLDIGNSAAKWRLVAGAEVLDRGVLELEHLGRIAESLPDGAAPEAIWVSSVASPDVDRQTRDVLQHALGVVPWFAQSQAQTGELVNSYAEPARMGVDRWLAMLGARSRSREALCVVDVGSAMTIDLVAADGRHEGGYIIPGPALMERALLLDTDRVRFEDDVDYQLSPGNSTAEAVRHGIALAQAGAVRAVDDLDTRVLLITGGGAEILNQLLDGAGEVLPDLVFDGLAIMAAASTGT